MSVATVIAALQGRHALLSGVTSAPVALPSGLNSAALPLAITLPGSCTWERNRLGGLTQNREYAVRVYVALVAQGAGIDEGFSKTTALIETFGDSYASSRAAGTGYQIQLPITDSGHVLLAWGQEQCHGFEYRFHVKEAT